MAFSKRIKTLASLIEPNTNVIDIGCDHGLLDIYLTKFNNNICIACDIKESALNAAIINIKKYDLNIKTIISNGLENVDVPDNCNIVIAGMGTNTIMDILKNEKAKKAKKLIIQTNNDYYELRKFMQQNKYKIVDEITIIDKKIRYIIIKFEEGQKKYSKLELKIGPILLNKNDSETKKYFKELLEENKKIMNKLPNKQLFKKFELIWLNNKIKKLI